VRADLAGEDAGVDGGGIGAELAQGASRTASGRSPYFVSNIFSVAYEVSPLPLPTGIGLVILLFLLRGSLPHSLQPNLQGFAILALAISSGKINFPPMGS
jgi:hypothetical protein